MQIDSRKDLRLLRNLFLDNLQSIIDSEGLPTIDHITVMQMAKELGLTNHYKFKHIKKIILDYHDFEADS